MADRKHLSSGQGGTATHDRGGLPGGPQLLPVGGAINRAAHTSQNGGPEAMCTIAFALIHELPVAPFSDAWAGRAYCVVPQKPGAIK